VAALTAAGVVALAGTAVVLVGPRIAATADRLADRTGLGEAAAGAILLGAATSLPGVVTTAVGAAAGDADFALSNAFGGIAVQTSFLPIADLALRRVNLEHMAASLPNLLQAALLSTLLALVLLASAGPDLSILGLHPISAVLVAAYVYGMRLAQRAHHAPMWVPQRTTDTVPDEPDVSAPPDSLSRLWARFGAFAAIMAVAGWAVGRSGLALADATGLSSSEVATLVTGVVTSFPELVVLLAAVRLGAPTLGVANVIGGNAFDAMFVPVADAAFRAGSVYHALTAEARFVLALTLTLTAVLTAGLLARQQRGIGFEGLAIAALYLGGMATLLAGV
jgi:cation:H+ antiporter